MLDFYFYQKTELKNMTRNNYKIRFKNPKVAIIIVFAITSILLAIASSFNLNDLIFPYIFALILEFIILMAIYAFLAFYLIPYVFYMPNGRQPFPDFLKSLKLTRKGLSLKAILLGLVLGTFSLIGLGFSGLILGESFAFSIDFNQLLIFPTPERLGTFNFINHISPALWEEIIFRGVFLTVLLKISSARRAIITDGILFGMFHFLNLRPETLFLTIGQVIYTTCSGITLAYLYTKTSNLIPCMLAHYVNNIISALIMLPEMNLVIFFIYVVLTSLVTLVLGLGIIKLCGKLEL